ncbi:MAG: LamG-like jellyroll fold domain-containing protein [Pseudomonadota bacterium]
MEQVVPASWLQIEGASDTAAVDEVRLFSSVLTGDAMRAFGSSRHTSGEALVAWDVLDAAVNGGVSDPGHNFSPIPELGDAYDAVMAGGVRATETGLFALDGTGGLETAPGNLHLDDALTVHGWFNSESEVAAEQLFQMTVPMEAEIGSVTFQRQQGMDVLYDREAAQFEVTIKAGDIHELEVNDEELLRDALLAVLANPEPDRSFEIVLTADIDLTSPLPSLVGDLFEGGGDKLAEGTRLTLRSDDPDDIKYIDGQNAHQILVIDDDTSSFTFRDMGFRNGLARGGVAEYGGGGGLGAGGALFIAGGFVTIDNVDFEDNSAHSSVPDTSADSHGQGGDDNDGDDWTLPGNKGANGQLPNATGDPGYFSAIPAIFAGEGGEGGPAVDDDDAERDGDPGTDGGWGSGGGQGGGGNGGDSQNNADEGGDGGYGGKGGFGAGGGGGGGSGGGKDNSSDGGSYGTSYAFGGNGSAGSGNDNEDEDGQYGGRGGAGAAFGGAIFVADRTNFSGLSRRPNVAITNSRFTNNKVVGAEELDDNQHDFGSESYGDAILFENHSGFEDGFGDWFPYDENDPDTFYIVALTNDTATNTDILSPVPTTFDVSTYDDLVKAIEEAVETEVDEIIRLRADIVLEGPLPVIGWTGAGRSSGGLRVESAVADGADPLTDRVRHAIDGDGSYSIFTMDNAGGYLELFDLELRNGLARGGDGDTGGGGGLGAGGAVYVGSGSVIVDTVAFRNNRAVGGDTYERAGKGGQSIGNGNGENGGAGGTLNGLDRYDLSDSFGFGGDGGDGGHAEEDGENGGNGEFGAGGGGGGGASSYYPYSGSTTGSLIYPDGGDGGSGGPYAGSGTDGDDADNDNEYGADGGYGGAGAGLGGAIFFRDATGQGATLSVVDSVFEGSSGAPGNASASNSVGEAEAHGDAIYTESGDSLDDEAATLQGFGSGARSQSNLIATVPGDDVTFTYASDGFSVGAWHHVAVGFANDAVPRVFLDGVALEKTDGPGGIEINEGAGFAASDNGMVRWGDIDGLEGGFAGQVDGFRFYDRALGTAEVFKAARGDVTRLIVQLDTGNDARDAAEYLYHVGSTSSFGTAWVELPKGSTSPGVVAGVYDGWNDVAAILGDDFSLELVGSGDGNAQPEFGDGDADTTPDHTRISLSGYSPEELAAALVAVLPKGISTPHLYVSADNLIDPDGFADEDQMENQVLSGADEPITLRFVEAFGRAGLSNDVSFVPLTRVDDTGEVQFNSNGAWVSYDEVTSSNPLMTEDAWKSVEADTWTSLVGRTTDLVVVAKDFLVLKAEKAAKDLAAQATTKKITGINALGNLVIEDVKTSPRGFRERVYDRITPKNPKRLKLFSKSVDFASVGARTVDGITQLAMGELKGIGTLLSAPADFPRKGEDLAGAYAGKKGQEYKAQVQKRGSLSLKATSAAVSGLFTLGSSIKTLAQDGTAYDYTKAALQLVSGVVLPIVDVALAVVEEAVATFTSVAAASEVLLAVAIVIDLALITADIIIAQVEQDKLNATAAEFAAEGYVDLINDLKEDISGIDDLYLSGRFAGAPADEGDFTDVDKLTGVKSWLYQALESAADDANVEFLFDMIIFIFLSDPKIAELSVAEFSDNFIDGDYDDQLSILGMLPNQLASFRSEFESVFDRWIGDEQEDRNDAVQFDLVGEVERLLIDENDPGYDSEEFREDLQQFVGERLDDGGTNEDADEDVFTVAEALVLDGTDDPNYLRNMAAYGTSDEEIRDEVKTARGNDTVLLGIGEFYVETGDGNDTVYVDAGLKDASDLGNGSKYYIDAGDLAEASPVLRSQRDSDTVSADPEQAVFVNLANGAQGLSFLDGTGTLNMTGVENVYGSDLGDELIGRDDKTGSLSGNDGDDILVTALGVLWEASPVEDLTTILDGGDGGDQLYGRHAGGLVGYVGLGGGDGNDLLVADGGRATLNGGAGSDRLVAALEPNSDIDVVFNLGLGGGQDYVEKGLNSVNVSSDGETAINFGFEDYLDLGIMYDGPDIANAKEVKDIIRLGQGIAGTNIIVTQDPEELDVDGTSPNPRYGSVIFAVIENDAETDPLFDLISGDAFKPNLQTGDAITVSGNWNEGYNHRVRELHFGDGSRLAIGHIENWIAIGTTNADNVELTDGNSFFQGFAGADIITHGDGADVILPGSGDDTVTVGQDDQILITRNPHDQDVVTIEGEQDVTVVLGGSIRLRDVGFSAIDNTDLLLVIAEGGNLEDATQTVRIDNAQGNVLLQFGTGFTLDLTDDGFDFANVITLGSEDDTRGNDGGGNVLITGGFGEDDITGSIERDVIIGGGGNDVLVGDNGPDLFILGDRDGMDTIDGGSGDNTILIVNTDVQTDQELVMARETIWFMTKDTVDALEARGDIDDASIPAVADGQLLIYVGNENNGALITDWDDWNDADRLVFANQYDGAFEISKTDVEALAKIMADYIDEVTDEERADDRDDNDTARYSPWNAELLDGGYMDADGDDLNDTIALNEALYDRMLDAWKETSSIIHPGTGYDDQDCEDSEVTAPDVFWSDTFPCIIGSPPSGAPSSGDWFQSETADPAGDLEWHAPYTKQGYIRINRNETVDLQGPDPQIFPPFDLTDTPARLYFGVQSASQDPIMFEACVEYTPKSDLDELTGKHACGTFTVADTDGEFITFTHDFVFVGLVPLLSLFFNDVSNMNIDNIAIGLR